MKDALSTTMSDNTGWSSELATTWRYYTPPSRPSFHDLAGIQRLVRSLRHEQQRREINLLILGSTSEYRELAFRERLNSTVVDVSAGYHESISTELVHVPRQERVVHQLWQELDLPREAFDLALGDLVVGNLQPSQLDSFLERLHGCMRPGGLFVTKSFIELGAHPPRRVEDWNTILNQVEVGDLFTEIAYDITVMLCDPHTRKVTFSEMYAYIVAGVASGRMPVELLDRVAELGWHDTMKIDFRVYSEAEWESAYSPYFEEVERIAEHKSPLERTPLFVLRKK